MTPATFRAIVRTLSTLLAVLYSVAYAPDWRGPNTIVEEVVVRYRTAGVIGIYVTMAVAVFASWFALPRYAWAARVVFWCFIALGFSVILTVWQTPFWVSGFASVRMVAEQLLFAMPSFFAAMFVACASRLSNTPQAV